MTELKVQLQPFGVDVMAHEKEGEMQIAKYRDERIPQCWILTDFTMEQVEGRIKAIEVKP